MPAKHLKAHTAGSRRAQPAPSAGPMKSTVDQDTLRGIGSVYDPTPEACRDAATALDRHAVRVGATAAELRQALAMLGVLSGRAGRARRAGPEGGGVKAKPSAALHLFEPDPDLGTGHDGRETCRRCSKPGRPGDAQHKLPPAPEAQHAMDERYLPERGTDA